MPKKLVPPDVIDALGGVPAVAKLLKTSRRSVYNWRKKFPANTYVVLQTELRKHQLNVPDSLWTMRALPGEKPRKPWKHTKRRGRK